MENSKAERPANSLNFGQAIEGIKEGKKAFRAGWNGKGMFVYLNKGSLDLSQFGEGGLPDKMEGIAWNLFETGDIGTITRLPNLNMKAASGSTVTGWLASQTDLLATDWNLEE